jgi:DNA-binding response OmpR family regulator
MPAPPLPVHRPIGQKPLRASRASLRVFVCDDDLDFADELGGALGLAGFEVRTLRDGKSPVEIFEFFLPDVVLLDIYMPPPDGFEVMSHLVSDTRQRDISLILASGADDNMLEVARQYCAARGIRPAAVLRKPVRLSEVLAVCRAHRDRIQAPPPA